MSGFDHEDLLQRLYSVSLLDGGLSGVLEDIAGIFPGLPIAYQAQCVFRNDLYDCTMFNHGPNAIEELGKAISANPFPPIALKASLSEVARTADYIAPEAVEQTDFYDEYLKTHGEINRAYGIILHRNGQDSAFVAANLPRQFDAHQERQVLSLFEFLRPHFQGAFQLLLEVKRRELRADAGSFWLEQIPTPAFIVSPDRKILHLNELARTAIATDWVFGSDRQSCLISASSHCDDILDRAIAQAHTSGAPVGPFRLAVAKHSGCILFAMPILRRDQVHMSLQPFLQPSSPVLLTVFDPRDAPRKAADLISTSLGLSQREGLLVQELICGASLREASEQLAISYHTARNQLASAMAKTRCRSQSDIVRLGSQILAKMPYGAVRDN